MVMETWLVMVLRLEPRPDTKQRNKEDCCYLQDMLAHVIIQGMSTNPHTYKKHT